MTDDLWLPTDDDLTWLAHHDPERAAELEALLTATAAHQRQQAETVADLINQVGKNQEHRPHLQLIDRELEKATDQGGARLIINIGPRYGKTTRVRWNSADLLRKHPDKRIIYGSYGISLAQEQSRWVRDLFEAHDLGIRPRRDTRRADRWWIEGHEGGMLGSGVGGGITGFGADLLVIDDIVKDAEQAHSSKWRERSWRWLTETAWDRLEPNASVVLLMTRWHPDDVTGRLLKEQPDVWTLIRIPTVAEPDDPIGRQPGELLWPERYDGPTVAEQRLMLGVFAFSARHQQQPTERSGGVWQEDWIRDAHDTGVHDPLELATSLHPRCVAVDPSASEEPGGDEAGIVCGGRDRKAGLSWLLADLSGLLTPDGWARRAIVAAVQLDCDIVYESNLTPVFMRRTLRLGWDALLREAGQSDDGCVAPVIGTGRVRLPGLMPAFKPVKAKVGKLLRAEPVAQLYEQRVAKHAVPMPVLEGQFLTWRPSDNDSPDRMDAAVHCLTWLGDRSGSQGSVHAPRGRIDSGVTGGRRGGLAGAKVALGKRQGF